jgi:hypothetical protein
MKKVPPVQSLPFPIADRPQKVTAKPSGFERSSEITTAQQKIIDSITRLENMGLSGIHKRQVSAFAGVSPKSGAYGNNLGALRTRGLISYPNPGYVALTDDGRSIASVPDRLDTTDDYHRAWFEMLSSARVKILKILIEQYPEALSKEELAIRAEVSPTSGAFGNNLGGLRSLGIIDYPQSGVAVATNILFPEGS